MLYWSPQLDTIMKISQSEYDRFCKEWKDKTGFLGDWKALRFGQAWFNYFSLQKHNASCKIESLILSHLYNETDEQQARATIRDNFLDSAN